MNWCKHAHADNVAILLAGCTTEGLGNVYILSLSYSKATQALQNEAQISAPVMTQTLDLSRNATSIDIRIGYFGFCLVFGRSVPMVCSLRVSTLADVIRSTSVAGGTSPDPLNCKC